MTRILSNHLANKSGLATLLAVSLASITPAQAAEKLRVAEQFGITYLLLHVARDQALIEKHGAERGVDIDLEWLQLSGGAAVNDALLSGNIDIAGAGVGPLLTVWDRTHGSQNVKGVASLGEFPNFLITNNPVIQTLEDIGEDDRIAVPAVGVSVQSRFLQKAVADTFGQDQFDRLEGNTMALPHPDATAALISGGTEINTHFSAIPFVTHSIEEAQVIGNRVLLLSPHPGRVRAELGCADDSLHSLGSEATKARTQTIHRLLFENEVTP